MTCLVYQIYPCKVVFMTTVVVVDMMVELIKYDPEEVRQEVEKTRGS